MLASTPSDVSPAFGPVPAQERHELIDVVRGFALFGVLLANLALTAYLGLTRATLATLPTQAVDLWAAGAIRYLIQGKFMFLFALLFGLGLAVQMERAAQRGTTVGPTYGRRLTVLFLFGVAHTVFLWFGDVLHIYALAGAVLYTLRRRSDRFLLIAGASLTWGSITVFWCLPALRVWLGMGGAPDPAARAQRVAARVEALTTGGYAEVIRDNLQIYAERYLGAAPLVFTAYAVGIFFLGFVLGRRRLLQEAPQHLAFFRRLLRWGLVVGVPLSLCSVFARKIPLTSPWHVPIRLPLMIGVAALAGAYLAGLVLLYQRPRGRRWLSWLAPVGRMALTNYLTHSVIYVLLFSGVGLGLAGRIGPTTVIPITLTVFGIQIGLSRLWLQHFRFGPMEWLWRSLTYARRQPLALPLRWRRRWWRPRWRLSRWWQSRA